MKKPYYVEIHTAKDNQFYWRLHDTSNKQVIMNGETHPRKHDCIEAWLTFEKRLGQFKLDGIGITLKGETQLPMLDMYDRTISSVS